MLLHYVSNDDQSCINRNPAIDAFADMRTACSKDDNCRSLAQNIDSERHKLKICRKAHRFVSAFISNQQNNYICKSIQCKANQILTEHTACCLREELPCFFDDFVKKRNAKHNCKNGQRLDCARLFLHWIEFHNQGNKQNNTYTPGDVIQKISLTAVLLQKRNTDREHFIPHQCRKQTEKRTFVFYTNQQNRCNQNHI